VLREVVRRTFPDLEFDVSEPPPQHDGPEGREQSRHPLVWSGVLHHDYQSTPVRLRNISATGVMIECSAPLRVGSEPLLELSESLSVSATVAWVVGDQAGLRFHAPFDLHDLAETRPQLTEARWEPPTYLATKPSTDSPWNDYWKRLSLGELKQQLDSFLSR
jgi:PilZ domain